MLHIAQFERGVIMYRRVETLELKFGEKICQIRKNAGYNQKEFSALLKIPQSTLSAYETDRMHPPIFTLVKIAKKFNVSMDWLCGIGSDNKLSEQTESESISPQSAIKITGKDFTAEMPANVSPELLAVLIDKLGDKNT